MQEIQKIFNYGETVVRTVYKDEEVWFVAKDVCEVLEIKNVTQAMNRLDEDERSMFNIGRQGETNIVSEAGLYSLILGSKKPEAKSFKRWVTHDVLPSIRKTGGYVANENMFVESYFSTLDDTQKVMLKAMLENTRKLKEENSIMQPKAQYFDALVDRQLLTNFRDTAKQIGVEQKELVEYLLANKYVYRDAKKKLKPYMQFVPELFEMKDWERNGKADVQTLVTPKGKETFRLLLREVS
ncbi:BRO family protein [Priestia flexa]|uniref:BRO family protein n=1 Tax=Priestia flexa TaxID=86664 RepID=UPI003D28EE83